MSEFSVRPDWMAFCLPDISEAEVQADADVIRSGWWAKGPRTMEFQKKFAEYVGAIIANQSADVDIVSGATVDCQAIGTAIGQAFAK